jgi:hypothetical protein
MMDVYTVHGLCSGNILEWKLVWKVKKIMEYQREMVGGKGRRGVDGLL